MTFSAGAIYALFVTRLISRSEIINWADSLISRSIKPDINLIDLSLCLNVDENDILKSLGSLAKREDASDIGKAVLGLLREMIREKRLPIESLGLPLFELSILGTLDRESQGKICHLMYLAEASEEGFGPRMDTETALRELSQ